MNFSQGHSGTKVRNVNRARFPKEKQARIHQKMCEIHELFVLALSLVWFAGTTPDKLSPKMPPNLTLPTREGIFSSFKITPRAAKIGNFCLAASSSLSQTLWAISPEKARFSRKDFCPIFSENLRLEPPCVSPPLRFSQQRLGPRFYIFRQQRVKATENMDIPLTRGDVNHLL